MKGHNWGKCRKCGKVHKSEGPTKGMKFPDRKFPEDKYPNKGMRNKKHSKGTKIEMSKKRKGRTCFWCKGKSYEEIMGSKERANERKKQSSERWKGDKNPMKNPEIVAKANTPEKYKNRKSLKGRKHSEDTKKKISEKMKGRKITWKITPPTHQSYVYKNLHFRSNGELGWFKWFEKINALVQYEYPVNGGLLDFGILNKKTKKLELVVEHHPGSRWFDATPENLKAYYKERRKILDDNGLNDVPLIVTTDLDETSKNKIIKLLGIKEIDRNER